jgi:uncharacterized protein YndB with AHSA1/START domain
MNPPSTPSGSRADRLGTLEETAAGWELRFVRRLAKPPAVVWRAFVDPELVARWFPTTIVGDLAAGAALRFDFTDVVADPFVGEVLEADEPRHLVFTWGGDVLRFDFAEATTGTELTMTVILDELGKAARDAAGWHECLDRLERSQSDAPDTAADRTWEQLHAAYVERFGPAASTLGPPQEFLDAQRDAGK